MPTHLKSSVPFRLAAGLKAEFKRQSGSRRRAGLKAGLSITALVIGLSVPSHLAAGDRSVPIKTAPSAEILDLFDPMQLYEAACLTRAGAGMQVLPAVAMARLRSLVDRTDKSEDVPLWDGLSAASYEITTPSDEAQAYFNQGFALIYGFNHYEAIRSFRKAQSLDPDCAMCYWGEAFAFGPNINLAMPDDAIDPANAALAKAAERAEGATAKEQALIAALQTRYSADKSADRAALNTAYAGAMGAVASQFPNDLDIQTLYADALMNQRPWDYWQADGTPYPEVAQLTDLLEGVLAANPDHPGAIHLYIHAVEATSTPERAEPFADRLADLMPGSGHLVHMPSHIYMRTGRHADSIELNLRAAEVDEAYLARTGAESAYSAGYYPHNVHFALVSAQLAGDIDTVQATAAKLPGLVPVEVMKQAFWTQPVKASAMLSLAHLGDADAVLALAKPSDDVPYVQAMWHYARGVVQAERGDLDAANAELKAIEKISADGGLIGYPQIYLPAELLGDIAMEVLAARIAQASGDGKTAIEHYETAVGYQDALPYTEPPFWYYPIRQSLGAALLLDGQHAAARRVFQQSLANQPNNAWAIYGLMKTYEAENDQTGHDATKVHFEKAWLGPDTEIDLSRI